MNRKRTFTLIFPPAILVLLAILGTMLGSQGPSMTWKQASLSLPTTGDAEDVSFTRISFVPTGEGWASFVMGEYPNLVHGVARSRDGESWELKPIPGYGGIDSFFFIDANRGWLSTTTDSSNSTAVLLQTTDGGQTWSRWSSLESLKVRALLDMRFAENGTGLAVGMVMPGQTGVVIRTNDAGKTWSLDKSTDHTLQRLAVRDANTFVMDDFGGILRKTTETDWQIVRQRGEEILMGLDMPTAQSVFAIRHYGAVFVSRNEGRSWNEIRLPVPHDDLFLGAIKFADAAHGWVAGHHGFILETSDGGKSWKLDSQVQSYFLRDIGVTDKRVFVVGDDGAIFWRDRP